jgi:hypothetical protein
LTPTSRWRLVIQKSALAVRFRQRVSGLRHSPGTERRNARVWGRCAHVTATGETYVESVLRRFDSLYYLRHHALRDIADFRAHSCSRAVHEGYHARERVVGSHPRRCRIHQDVDLSADWRSATGCVIAPGALRVAWRQAWDAPSSSGSCSLEVRRL